MERSLCHAAYTAAHRLGVGSCPHRPYDRLALTRTPRTYSAAQNMIDQTDSSTWAVPGLTGTCSCCQLSVIVCKSLKKIFGSTCKGCKKTFHFGCCTSDNPRYCSPVCAAAAAAERAARKEAEAAEAEAAAPEADAAAAPEGEAAPEDEPTAEDEAEVYAVKQEHGQQKTSCCVLL